MIRSPRLLVTLCACLVGVTSCSGGSETSTLSTVTTRPAPATTSSLPTTTSTTLAVTTTSVAPSVTDEVTPEAQAKAFYDAWARGDRAAAATLGEPAAVTAIFARPWSAADGWSFSECSGAAGSAICAWNASSQEQLLLLVRGATGGLPVMVVDVRFAQP